MSKIEGKERGKVRLKERERGWGEQRIKKEGK